MMEKNENLYYYSFYILVLFSKKVNKHNNEYAFSAMAYLSILMGFNLFTLLAFFQINGLIHLHEKWIYIVSMLSIMTVNYFLLIYKNKSQQIISFYAKDRKYQRLWAILGFGFYVILTFLLCGYSAYLVRIKL